jgi:hypothetical protein
VLLLLVHHLCLFLVLPFLSSLFFFFESDLLSFFLNLQDRRR